ncbi:MAG: DUF805 domain-containing protein [Chloroflexi bacterium]|nr:DUF805 domain-containing protein [Chloroflexota bacterium]
MSFTGAITQCLRKYVEFNGRATRAEFWWWVLAVVIVSFALNAFNGFINALVGQSAFSILPAVFSLAVLLPNLVVTSRRLHDIGKSGWWLLVWIVASVLGTIPLGIGIAAMVIAVWSGESWWGHPDFWMPLLFGVAVSFLVWIGLFIWWLLWMVRQGQPGANRFGPDPRA